MSLPHGDVQVVVVSQSLDHARELLDCVKLLVADLHLVRRVQVLASNLRTLKFLLHQVVLVGQFSSPLLILLLLLVNSTWFHTRMPLS